MIEYLPLVLTGIGIIASILYYASVLRNADNTRRTQLLMDVKKQLDDPKFWLTLHKIESYKWNNYEEYEEKYGRINNPQAAAEIDALLAFYNSIGVLVATDRIDVDLLGMHLGPMPVRFWNQFKDVILERRRLNDYPYMYVYFEYLKDEHLKRVTRPRGKASYLDKYNR